MLEKGKRKSTECHNHKPQPSPDTKMKRKQTKPNKRKSNKHTKSTKTSSLFPKRGVWDPHEIVVQEELEKVRNRAARFVTLKSGSMTSILEQLGWESLHKRRNGSKLILLFKVLKGRASSIPCDDLQSPNRRSRNQHLMVFQVPYDRTGIYK